MEIYRSCKLQHGRHLRWYAEWQDWAYGVRGIHRCEGDALAVVPMEVLDEKNIYAPSRVMKSIQYLLDKGVVRVWNDAVLSMPDRGALPNAKPELYESNE